ncbi:HDOD domain-containing protein [Spirochaetota bacterium]
MRLDIKERIENLAKNLESLPSLPAVASKIIQLVSDPNVSFKMIAEEISKDQSMTTNLLKLSNSAYFSKGKEITSVERAIVIMGLKEVKDIIMVIATKPILNKEIIGYDLEKGILWQQGLLVSDLAKRIAIMKKRKDIADVVFTGGIIHNVGKVILALFVKSAFSEIIDAVQNKNMTFSDAEREIMGFSHQEIGEMILNKWEFPPVLKSIVRYYQEPGKAPDEFKLEVSIVHIASVLSLMAGVGIGSDGMFYEFSQDAISKVGISENAIEELFSMIPDIISQTGELV